MVCGIIGNLVSHCILNDSMPRKKAFRLLPSIRFLFAFRRPSVLFLDGAVSISSDVPEARFRDPPASKCWSPSLYVVSPLSAEVSIGISTVSELSRSLFLLPTFTLCAPVASASSWSSFMFRSARRCQFVMIAKRVYALELHSEFVYKYPGSSGLNVLIMKFLPVLCRQLYRMHSSRSRVIAL